MARHLVILSFASAGLLVVSLPVQRICMSVPNLALVLWLVVYNVIHAINAIIWTGNADVHVVVWCDIMTKVMLGAAIALPGALLCVAMHLEFTTSSRTISITPKYLRNRTIFEFTLCYLVPVIYMLSHLVAQDRRFDLLKDYGCFPSTHPSTLAFLLLWIPPLTMSGIAFVFYGISIHNIGVLRGTYLTAHLEARSTMNSSIFYRRLSTGMILTGALILISLSSLFSVHSFQPWISWNDVHSKMSTIEVVSSPDDITNIRFTWWAYFTFSCLYIFLSFAIGEETRDMYRWLAKRLKGQWDFRALRLPLYSSNRRAADPAEIPPSSPITPSPLTVELKSGWDDRWDSKPVRKGSKRSAKSSSSGSSSSPVNEMMDDDLEFMSSTLSYLGSPTAQSLGVVPPLPFPSPVRAAPPRSVFEIPPKPSSPPPLPRIVTNIPKNASTDVEPPIKSVFDAAWPIPPSSPSPSPSLPRSFPRSYSRSRSRSPTSPNYDAAPSSSYPRAIPSPPGGRPFEDSYTSDYIEQTSSIARPPVGKPIPPRPTLQALRRAWSKERLREGNTSPEAIRMTVVQEIA